MVVIYSQTLRVGVIPEEIAVDLHPGRVVGFPEVVAQGVAEGGCGEVAAIDGEESLGF